MTFCNSASCSVVKGVFNVVTKFAKATVSVDVTGLGTVLGALERLGLMLGVLEGRALGMLEGALD